jgi:hypothetical protein
MAEASVAVDNQAEVYLFDSLFDVSDTRQVTRCLSFARFVRPMLTAASSTWLGFLWFQADRKLRQYAR